MDTFLAFGQGRNLEDAHLESFFLTARVRLWRVRVIQSTHPPDKGKDADSSPIEERQIFHLILLIL